MISSRVRTQIYENAFERSTALAAYKLAVENHAKSVEAIYDYFYQTLPPTVLVKIEKFKQIKDDLVDFVTLYEATNTGMTVTVGHENIFMPHSGQVEWNRHCSTNTKYKLALHGDFQLSPNNPLMDSFRKTENEVKLASEALDEFSNELRNSLACFKSVSQMVKLWPESAALLPKEEKAATNLPALVTDKLNKALNLP